MESKAFPELTAAMSRKTVKGWSWIKTAYNNLKIQQKLFWQQYLLVLIIGTVSLGGIQIAFNLYDGLLYNESAKALNLSMINIENELKQIEEISFALLANGEIQSSLRRLEQPLSPTEHSQIRHRLTEILWTYVFERNVVSVHLVDNNGLLYSGGPSLPKSLVEPIRTQAVLGSGSARFIETLPGENSLICARQVREIHNFTLHPLGTLIIRINTKELVRQATVDTESLRGNLLIYNGTKKIFASGPAVETLENRLVFGNGSGYRVVKINGHTFFVAQTRSSERGWVYLNVLPYDTVFRPVIIMRTLFMAVFALLLGVALIVSKKTARSLTKPIENLTAQMKKVENGDFTLEEQALPEVDRDDEVGQLQRDFLIMTRKINALIQENYTKQIVIKDTRFRALQAQINPHFLYNTMESINWLAKLGGQPEISRMVEALGNLMRSAMSDREDLINLQRELELVRDYILIQQIRFGERLGFELDIDPARQQLLIPKLTLQPIVENSIRYGLETVTGVCRIRITAGDYPGGVEIRVEDNGPGLDPEIMRKLDVGEVLPEGNGIGLKNIDTRLRLMFGEEYGLKIESRSGGGTVVRVRIPGGEYFGV